MPDDRTKALLTLAHALDACGISPWWLAPAAFATERERRVWRGVVAEHGASRRVERAS